MSIVSYPVQDRRGAGRSAAAPPRPARAVTHALMIHQAEIVRLGVSTMLTSGSACEVASAASVYEAFRLASDVHPQLVLFDFTPAEGPEVCRLLAALWPKPRLIALVTRGREVSPNDCLSVGADAAMLMDNVNRETFLVVIRRVMDGLGPIVAGFPSVNERLDAATRRRRPGLAADPARARDALPHRPGSLQPRDRRVARPVGQDRRGPPRQPQPQAQRPIAGRPDAPGPHRQPGLIR